MKKHGKKHKTSKISLKKEIIRHVKEDEKDFKKEIARDKSLLKRVAKSKKHHSSHKDPKHTTKKQNRNKVELVMHEFKEGKLHSGSKKGPQVTNPRQAIAIALSESRRLGKSYKKKKKK